MRPTRTQGAQSREDDGSEREDHCADGGHRTLANAERASGYEATCHRGQDGCRTRRVHSQYDGQRRVGATAQPVEEGDRPTEIGKPVDEPPGPESDSMPQGAGDQHGDHQIQGQSAQTNPNRTVGRTEGDEGVEKADRYVPIAHRGDHVDRHQAKAKEGQIAVHRLGEESGPPLGGPSDGCDHADDDARGEGDERPQSRRPGEIPESGRTLTDRRFQREWRHARIRRRPTSAFSSGSEGHPATVTACPSNRIRRAGRPRASSHPGAAGPLMTDAVDAMLASTHDPATTDTVRQQLSTGSPVVGSTMWWTVRPPSSQRRAPVPEVANPPGPSATLTGHGPSVNTSEIPISKRVIGSPVTETSPPRDTSAAQPSWSVMA